MLNHYSIYPQKRLILFFYCSLFWRGGGGLQSGIYFQGPLFSSSLIVKFGISKVAWTPVYSNHHVQTSLVRFIKLIRHSFAGSVFFTKAMDTLHQIIMEYSVCCRQQQQRDPTHLIMYCHLKRERPFVKADRNIRYILPTVWDDDIRMANLNHLILLAPHCSHGNPHNKAHILSRCPVFAGRVHRCLHSQRMVGKNRQSCCLLSPPSYSILC